MLFSSSVRVMMSISQCVNRLARRTFWPFLPIARDSWSSSTITRALRLCSSSWMCEISAGLRALVISPSCSEFQRMMSIRSPLSSSMIDLIRVPRTPTHAPTQSTLSSLEWTASLVL